ncbi:leucine-rich repeat extensin-like protein 5 isoform X2 [Macadamia integrifolia]|uniref:leucine-rich repeat extensin-like protein 5 isoform X2 n=1 Tax=Macadamia integrifolia TaxID=60698 RepID=UPI001C4F5A6A|nr:leucine-rich repeat extensin-like protein 5 isoform X2 [Macadamia integrifolia]
MTIIPMPSSTSTASGDPQNPSLVNQPSSRDSRQTITSPPPPTTSVTNSSPATYAGTSQVLPFVGTKTPNPPPQMASKITQDTSSVPPSQPQGILYPVASSGRGYIPKSFRPQSPDQLVTIANPGGAGFPPRSLMSFPNQVQVQLRPFGFAPGDPQTHPVHLMKPPHLQPSSQIASRQMGAPVPGTIKSVPAVLHPKVAPFSSSTTDFNSYKELRSRDDTVVTIHDRKVRLSDGASLYALCRSWVQNGLPQENPPLFGEGVKLLPRPLPVTADTSPKKYEADDDEEVKKEGTISVENLPPRDLLQRHIKRAKRVRARLREERLQRIARYKQRLALLLPPPVEQLRNDATPGS